MAKEKNKHHDNREHNWYISLYDFEKEAAESRRAQTGLSKAEFGRQALMEAKVISRVNAEDKKALNDLSHMRADIDRLIHICENSGVKEALFRILKIEDMFSKIYNYLKSKIG